MQSPYHARSSESSVARNKAALNISFSLNKPRHFTIVLLGNGNNGQTSIWHKLQGKEPVNNDNWDMQTGLEAKEVQCEYNKIKYRLTVVDSGEGIEAMDDCEDSSVKQSFR